MKLDDTHEDYFLADGDDSARQGKTITFDGDTGAGNANSSATSSEQTENCVKPVSTPKHKVWKWLAGLILVALLVLGMWIWLHFYNPYVSDARMRCYVVNVEKRGVLFKTFEADVVTEQSLTDTARVYSKETTVSVPDVELAKELQHLQGTGRLVTLNYETFNGVLPWRGASRTVITSIGK